MELVNYVRGTLPRGRAAVVRQHTRTCAACGDQLAAVMLLRERAGLVTPAPRWRRPAAAAAVVVIAAGLSWFAGDRGPSAIVEGATAPATEREPLPTALGDVDGDGPLLPRDDPALVQTVRVLASASVSAVEVGLAERTGERAVLGHMAAGRFGDAAAAGAASDVDLAIRGVALYMAGDARGAAELLRYADLPAPGKRAPAMQRFATLARLASYMELGELDAVREIFADPEQVDVPEGQDRIDRTIAAIGEQLDAEAAVGR